VSLLNATDEFLGSFGNLCLYGLGVYLCALHFLVGFFLLYMTSIFDN
jgi:hypothetical protein